MNNNTEAQYRPSLQELKAPTISYKDRKLLMLLYDGKLKKADKVNRLIKRGYAQMNLKGEISPTVLGSLLIDFTVRQREKDARKSHPPVPIGQDEGVVRLKGLERNPELVSDGELRLGNSGES